MDQPEFSALDGIDHRFVSYEPAEDIETAAQRRGTEVTRILKTMVVHLGAEQYVLVLVPGDRLIDWKALRGHLGVRRLALADEEEAFAATGYRRGTITPFGAAGWPVIVDALAAGSGETSVLCCGFTRIGSTLPW
jgi:prolyl-tRNA editing enzyme YbaK/EbsC (Cys-tRNA(Pro) deacylase)